MTARVDFYVVTVRVSNEARRATLTFENPQATLIDLPGQIYQRSLAAEAALAAPGTPTPFARTVSAQHSYTKTLVFDVPEHVLIPRMKVSMGHPLERLIELFLIGDEDSLFHEKTMFALDV